MPKRWLRFIFACKRTVNLTLLATSVIGCKIDKTNRLVVDSVYWLVGFSLHIDFLEYIHIARLPCSVFKNQKCTRQQSLRHVYWYKTGLCGVSMNPNCSSVLWKAVWILLGYCIFIYSLCKTELIYIARGLKFNGTGLRLSLLELQDKSQQFHYPHMCLI